MLHTDGSPWLLTLVAAVALGGQIAARPAASAPASEPGPVIVHMSPGALSAADANGLVEMLQHWTGDGLSRPLIDFRRAARVAPMQKLRDHMRDRLIADHEIWCTGAECVTRTTRTRFTAVASDGGTAWTVEMFREAVAPGS